MIFMIKILSSNISASYVHIFFSKLNKIIVIIKNVIIIIMVIIIIIIIIVMSNVMQVTWMVQSFFFCQITLQLQIS